MEIKLSHLALHLVGNKADEEGVHLAKSNASLNEDLRNILSKFFLNSFNIGEFFHLYHDSGLEYNVPMIPAKYKQTLMRLNRIES